MIEGGVMSYVAAAYAVTGVALAALVVAIVLRARRWAKAARALEQRK